jgi:hypothetical protein
MVLSQARGRAKIGAAVAAVMTRVKIFGETAAARIERLLPSGRNAVPHGV